MNDLENFDLVDVSKEPEPGPPQWLLEGLIPQGTVSIIYGEGGLGKSLLATYIGVKAVMGNQQFLGLKFHQEPLRTLYLDWETTRDSFIRRAYLVARGLGLERPPEGLFYYCPRTTLQKFITPLQKIIQRYNFQFILIDSLGASGLDPGKMMEVVEAITRLRSLGVTILAIDHQAKLQAGEDYSRKSPFGSVYKLNLARSVIQVTKLDSSEDSLNILLRHKKINEGPTYSDIKIKITFDSNKIIFERATTPDRQELKEKKFMRKILNVIIELESKGQEATRQSLWERLKEQGLGRDKLYSLLEKGENVYWRKERQKNRHVYKSLGDYEIPSILIEGSKLVFPPGFWDEQET